MPSMKDKYDREVHQYPLYSNCPSSVSKRLDEWWSEVLPSLDCPHLSMFIKSAMSIFTGPMIEQSFRQWKFLQQSRITNVIELKVHHFHFCAKRTSKRIKILETQFLNSPIKFWGQTVISIVRRKNSYYLQIF